MILWNIQFTLSCIRTLVNQLKKKKKKNCVWYLACLNSTVWFQLEWPWCSLKVRGSQENKSLCSYSVEKLHEATQMFMMVDYVKEMTLKKSFMVNMDHLSICSSCWDLKGHFQPTLKPGSIFTPLSKNSVYNKQEEKSEEKNQWNLFRSSSACVSHMCLLFELFFFS